MEVLFDPRLLSAYVLVIVLRIADLPSYRRRAEAMARDDGSMEFLRTMSIAGFGLAFAYRFWLVFDDTVGRAHVLRALDLGPYCIWIGLAFALGGAWLRNSAIRALGRNFTRTVQVSVDQTLVETGPYRRLRHPAYTGVILSGLGVGTVLGSVVTVAVVLAALGIGYARRIPVEERAMREILGDRYRAWTSRTWRLVPFLF